MKVTYHPLHGRTYGLLQIGGTVLDLEASKLLILEARASKDTSHDTLLGNINRVVRESTNAQPE